MKQSKCWSSFPLRRNHDTNSIYSASVYDQLLFLITKNYGTNIKIKKLTQGGQYYPHILLENMAQPRNRDKNTQN